MTETTSFCVRVRNAAEARDALDGGADRLALDAAAALDASALREVARAAPDLVAPVEAGGADDPVASAVGLLDAGAAAVEFAARDDPAARLIETRRRRPAARGWLALSPDDFSRAAFGTLAEAGFRGAILRPAARPAPRLIEAPGVETLAAFVEAARRRGLEAGFEGALEAPDVPRMLALRPDVLVFRTSLCRDGRRDAPLDPERVAMMRALIPRGAPTPAPVFGDALPPRRADRVFVRDFVVEAGVGAYGYERRAPQRMRFNVEADLAPIRADAADMRDVFSYDVIVDAIRLATRRHVILVERIAQDVAAASLRDPRVRRVRVRIEKLDILDGSVGVEIERDRMSEERGANGE